MEVLSGCELSMKILVSNFCWAGKWIIIVGVIEIIYHGFQYTYRNIHHKTIE